MNKHRAALIEALFLGPTVGMRVVQAPGARVMAPLAVGLLCRNAVAEDG